VNIWTTFIVEWLPNLANAATAIGGVGILLAILPLLQARKQRLRDAEQWYVERYWAIQDRIEVGDLDGRLKKMPTEKDIYDELRLCEDELDLRRNGFLTNPTWRIWSGSIQAIKIDPAKIAVLERAEEMTLLRAYLQNESDPIEVGWPTALVRGLY
jgi:hypothetical protein